MSSFDDFIPLWSGELTLGMLLEEKEWFFYPLLEDVNLDVARVPL
jgi:hypothetical protein